MSLWRHLARGLRGLLRSSAADRDADDEIRHFEEQAAAAHLASGLSPDAARRAARVEMGSPAAVRDEVRASGWEHAIETGVADLRYSARGLRASPGSTAIVVLTLSVGIGGTTAIFSAVKPVLLDPVPYADADRIVAVRELRKDGSSIDGTFGMFRWFAERARGLDVLAVVRSWQPTFVDADQPERLAGQRISADYFRVLGVSPALGRGFLTSEDQPNGPSAVLLSDRLWRRHFGADTGIIGRAVRLDDVSRTVVGVMPAGFENVIAPDAEVWAPLQYDLSLGAAWGHHLRTVGRLRAGVDVDDASDEIDRLGQEALTTLRPETYGRDVRFAAVPMAEEVTRSVRPVLRLVMGAVTLVLLVACANAANMLLARGVHRRAEFGVRVALGAGRRRLLRLLLTESLLLASIGGVLGLAIAGLGVRALVALGPADLARVDAIQVDRGVFLFALGLTTLVGVVIGLVSAYHASPGGPELLLHGGSRRTTGPRRARSALVVAEVALALVLLVGSGLLFRSLVRLLAVPVGFDASRLLTLQVHTAGARFAEPGAASRFFEDVVTAVRQVPGVAAAAVTSQLPLSGDRDEYGARFDPNPAQGYGVFRYAVSPGYVETMALPLRSGRTFDVGDRAGAPPVAMISESLARLKFKGTDAIGQRLRVGPPDGPRYTIVGVVGDVRQMSLAQSESDAVYMPASQWRFEDRVRTLIVRAVGDDAAVLAPAVREAVWSVDRRQPIARVRTMDDLLAATSADRRFALLLFEAFAAAALVLAGAGIYGVLAGSVAERTREIGVRAALGASRAAIVSLVVREAAALTVLGVAIGIAAAAVASGAIGALLFGVSRFDATTHLAVIAVVVSIAVVASGLPAWRASRVDAATTLRAE